MNKNFTLIIFSFFQILGLHAQTYFGKPNVLVDGNIIWHENYKNTTGYFINRYTIATPLDGVCSVIADDIDGNLDVATAAFWDNKVVWFRNYTLKVTSQRQNITVPCDSVATFIISVVNADTYCWQENNGGGFTNLQDHFC